MTVTAEDAAAAAIDDFKDTLRGPLADLARDLAHAANTSSPVTPAILAQLEAVRALVG